MGIRDVGHYGIERHKPLVSESVAALTNGKQHYAHTLLSRGSSLTDDCHVRFRIFCSTTLLEKNDEDTTRKAAGA